MPEPLGVSPASVVCTCATWDLQQVMAGELGSLPLPGFWSQPGPGLTVTGIWGVNQQMQDLSIYLPFKEIKVNTVGD